MTLEKQEHAHLGSVGTLNQLDNCTGNQTRERAFQMHVDKAIHSLEVGVKSHSSHAVTASHMGSIYTTFLTLQNYSNALELVQVKGVRWPGGMVAESDPKKYSLTFPDIFVNDFRTDRGLSDMMSYANSSDLSLSMIIPTMRYMLDPQQGVADLEQFLKRLLRGDFGRIPQDFTLEIGNETSHVGWQSGKFTPGVGSYGFIADTFLTAMNRILDDETYNPSGIALKVAVQMSTTVGGQQSIFSQISAENLRTVDGFVRHSGLVLKAEDLNVGYEIAKVSALTKWWEKAWNGSPPELTILDTAWAVGPSDHNAVASGKPELDYDLGARQAGAVVETFSKLIAAGSDGASVWGVQNNPSSKFYFSGEKISYGGHAFRLIAESLTGTYLAPGKIGPFGEWIKSGNQWDSTVYSDAAKAVIFVAAEDIPIGGLAVTISLEGFGEIAYAWAEVISSSQVQATNRTVLSSQMGTSGPVVSRVALDVHGNSVLLNLLGDYEMYRVIAVREKPQVGHIHFWGSNANDVFRGGSSSDLLEGGTGDDQLFGGPGADTMDGGLGNDWYFVDDANDVVLESATNLDGEFENGRDRVISSVSFSLASTSGVHSIEDLVLAGDEAINATGNRLSNRLVGNGSSNMLFGELGDDILFGGDGNDTLAGGGGNDRLFGGAGNDTLDGGLGANLLIGGAGDDVYVVNSVHDRVVESIVLGGKIDSGGADMVRSFISFSLEANVSLEYIENLSLLGGLDIDAAGNDNENRIFGNSGSNKIFGAAGDDQLSGWAGDDVLFGGEGNDALFGGRGEDTLSGLEGEDTLMGGANDDYYVINSASDQVFETVSRSNLTDAGGVDTIESFASVSLTSSVGVSFVENVLLSGSRQIDATGNDLSNKIEGNVNDNRIFGGRGNDTVNGGGGKDTLLGGAGKDTFVFSTRAGVSNIDHLADFDPRFDGIALDSEVYFSLLVGSLSSSAFVSNIAGAATTELNRIIYEIDTGALYYDSDGTGSNSRVHFAFVSSGLELTPADFSVF